MISPKGNSVKEFGALSWSYEITFKSNSRELRFEEERFEKLWYFLTWLVKITMQREDQTDSAATRITFRGKGVLVFLSSSGSSGSFGSSGSSGIYCISGISVANNQLDLKLIESIV